MPLIPYNSEIKTPFAICFFIAQYAKPSQLRTRYWNSVLKNTDGFKENYVASAFAHPSLLVLSDVDSAPTLHPAKWGLILSWTKNAQDAEEISSSTLNARGETIFEKPSFANSAKHSRCLIPVNGFY